MITTDTDGARAGANYVTQLLSNSSIRVFNREWIDGEIAKVADAPLLKWVYLQHRIPRADHGRLHANVSRAEARTRAVGCASVEGNSNQGKVKFFCMRDVWQPHECRHAGKAWIDQRVHRHGVRLGGFLGSHNWRTL